MKYGRGGIRREDECVGLSPRHPASGPEFSTVFEKLGKLCLQMRKIPSQGTAIGDGMDEANGGALHRYITPLCRRLRNPDAVTIT